MRHNSLGLFLGLLVALFFGSCVHGFNQPRNPYLDISTRAPTTFDCPAREIRVAFDPHFSQRQIELGVYSLSFLQGLGIKAFRANHGEQADVTVRFWHGHHCRNDTRLGSYVHGTNYVLIDPACTVSEQQFQASVLHEIGHWLGMVHICEKDGKTTDVCSPVGMGDALMNPYLGSDHTRNPTELDLLEYRRACYRFGLR